jgi:hypothetical protein
LNLQDNAVGIFERRLGSKSCIRKGILDYLKDRTPVIKSENNQRELIKYINLVDGFKNLSMSKLSELKTTFDKFPIKNTLFLSILINPFCKHIA